MKRGTGQQVVGSRHTDAGLIAERLLPDTRVQFGEPSVADQML